MSDPSTPTLDPAPVDAARREWEQTETQLRRRIKKLEALVQLSRGELRPMQALLIKRLRAQILATSPERIDEMAREVYREWMRRYELEDAWEVESPVRRRDLGITVETVLQILERDLAMQDLLMLDAGTPDPPQGDEPDA